MDKVNELRAPILNMRKAKVYAAHPQIKALHEELLALPCCQLHGTVSVLLKVKKCMSDDRDMSLV